MKIGFWRPKLDPSRELVLPIRRPPPPRDLIVASLKRSGADLAKRALFGQTDWEDGTPFPARVQRPSQKSALSRVPFLGPICLVPFFLSAPHGGHWTKSGFFENFRTRSFQRSKNQDLYPPNFFIRQKQRRKYTFFTSFLALCRGTVIP